MYFKIQMESRHLETKYYSSLTSNNEQRHRIELDDNKNIK